jgi:predicted metal-binding protein
MERTPPNGPDVTVFICISCKGQEATTEKPGQFLFDIVTTSLSTRSDNAVTITPVECLAVCKRPCTVALAAAGKWTYVVGDLDPQTNVDDIITAAFSYRAAGDGIIPWRQRPQSFRKGIVSRVPPLGFRLEGQGS